MIRIFTIACILLVFAATGWSQAEIKLNPEERAYFFHIVKKSPILESNIGRYVEYVGPEVRFYNGLLNYDSVETLIINQPDLLVIREQEIAKSTKGIIAEAANKMAILELNKMLLAKRNNDETFELYKSKYAHFEQELMRFLPATAKNTEGTAPHPRLDVILNPNLSLDDKVAQMNVFKGMTIQDELLTIQAISRAINTYVQQRAYEIYLALGGEADTFQNVLVAAGDGSMTSGLLDEREKDEKGRWNKGLPKAVGLFPYEVKLSTPEKKKEEPKIEPLPYAVIDFQTVGENRMTNLHFDVWGYNSEKQTTVVIEKNGKVYRLYGNKETRFLSPDSTFGGGTTYQTLLHDLEYVKIADITEKIEGKKGYDYWIAHYEQKRDETEERIIRAEKAYSDMGYAPITTSSKPSRQVKKNKKRAMKAGTGADSWEGAPTTNSGKSSKSAKQNEIVALYDRFQWYKAKIKELEQEKAEAIDLRARYQLRLDKMKDLYGRHEVTFIESEGKYLFDDSASFDIYTQEFQFPQSTEKVPFEVKLLSIYESSLSNQADEVMLHTSLIDAKPNYNARLQLAMNDQFGSDSYALDNELLGASDSLAMRLFFEALQDKKIDFELIARGQGVGVYDGNHTVKQMQVEELSGYGSKGREDSTFVRLRHSELFVHLDRTIVLEVNSFTDPVRSNFSAPSELIRKLQSQNKLSNNDVLSAYRTVAILKKFKEELNVMAGMYLTREEAKIVIDRFNRTFEKARVSIGHTSARISDF